MNLSFEHLTWVGPLWNMYDIWSYQVDGIDCERGFQQIESLASQKIKGDNSNMVKSSPGCQIKVRDFPFASEKLAKAPNQNKERERNKEEVVAVARPGCQRHIFHKFVPQRYEFIRAKDREKQKIKNSDS